MEVQDFHPFCDVYFEYGQDARNILGPKPDMTAMSSLPNSAAAFLRAPKIRHNKVGQTDRQIEGSKVEVVSGVDCKGEVVSSLAEATHLKCII